MKYRLLIKLYLGSLTSFLMVPFNLAHAIILPEKVILPIIKKEEQHVWHLFVIRCNERDKLQKHLLENQIQTLIHYPIPPHKQKAYDSWNNMSFPITEKIHNEVLSLPISQIMNEEEVHKVIDAVNNFN